MRILIFSLVYYPRFVGGAEVAIKEITDRISPETIVFDMVTLRKHANSFELIGNVHVHRVGIPWRGKRSASSRIFPFSKYLYVFLALRKAVQLHKLRRYDAIWSVMANYAGFSALFFKRLFPQVPFLLTLQEGDSLEHIRSRVGVFYPLFKKIFTKADRIQTISNYLADWAKRMGAQAPIEVVPNGVDVEKFKVESGKLKVGEMREKLGLGAEEKIVITTSRLVEKNGVGDLIEAMSYLPENVKLLILGSGPLERSLKSKVESLKLGERVRFLGYISHADLPQYLHASDIFCRPSLSEGLGNSFLEAMAAGLPVVATPVGGIPDFLHSPLRSPSVEGERKGVLSPEWEDTITGLFCQTGNPKDIAKKIQFLLSDEALRTRIIANAERMVSERYDWEGIAQKMRSIFVLTKAVKSVSSYGCRNSPS